MTPRTLTSEELDMALEVMDSEGRAPFNSSDIYALIRMSRAFLEAREVMEHYSNLKIEWVEPTKPPSNTSEIIDTGRRSLNISGRASEWLAKYGDK